MPKRLGYKRERVVSEENCIQAVREMLKGKKRPAKYSKIFTANKPQIRRIIARRISKKERFNSVAYFRAHAEEIGRRLASDLREGTWRPKPCREKLIFDDLRDKWRHLKVPCLYDQCAHHAIMRQTIPDIMARKYYYDCGSVPKAGQSRAVDILRRKLKKKKKKPFKYALSMDVHHFFESLQAYVVIRALRKIYKDRRFLALHEIVLEGMGGVLAIGFYPSPWYANLVLGFLIDRFIKQQFMPRAFFVRYMDDMVVCCNNKRLLHKLRKAISNRLARFNLSLKGNWQVYPIAKRGIAFLSYRFFPGYTLVRKKIMLRIAKCAKSAARGLTPRIAMAMISYKGILLRCNSYTFRKTRIYPYTSFKKCRKVIRYVAALCRALQQATGSRCPATA